MSSLPRKKSPRAPSIALDGAIERALRVYDKEGRHPAPLNVVANHLGYKSANNGAFMATIASLRYYGLVDRPKEGYLAVSKEVESFKFAPSDDLRQQLQIKWLKNPTIFNELLQQYGDHLPSDANIKFDLIHRGFNPKTADECVTLFRKSIDVARYFDSLSAELRTVPAEETSEETLTDLEGDIEVKDDGGGPNVAQQVELGNTRSSVDNVTPPEGRDRIPVRLAGGRRAWLEIPEPFYEADKKRLIAQIELILTEDEESSDES